MSLENRSKAIKLYKSQHFKNKHTLPSPALLKIKQTGFVSTEKPDIGNIN